MWTMKIVSVNVGLPREVMWKGKRVTTGIFKEPITGRVMMRRLNLDGDRQADLSVHGGPSKAVYIYPVEHYDYWRGELPEMKLPWGMFGENLTTEGLREDAVGIGDRFRIGSAEVMVTEPRLPCYKLGIKFGREDIIKRFLRSGRTGFYVAVVQEGEVGAGDTINLISRDGHSVTVADITRLYVREKNNRDLLHRAVRVEALPESWRDYFSKQIEKLGRPVEREPQTKAAQSPCCE
jgi:MOSC domain-containing protein YiiM